MDRRNFIYRMLAGVASTTSPIALTPNALIPATRDAKENWAVEYQVKGFTCETCAVGLETMFLQHPGIKRASASYPDGRVAVGFDRACISEETIRELITGCGFTIR